MASVLKQPIGDILDNYADVIEGGTSWRGSGTAYLGIPGRYSNDTDIRSGADSPLTAASASANATTVVVANTYSWEASRWGKDETPAYWLLCTASNGSGAPNLDRARKVASYAPSTFTFTVAAFPGNPAQNDTFDVLQGFKRLPNGIDIEADDVGVAHGFDRFFHLSAGAGEQLEWHGSGVATFKTTLELRLRLLAYGRLHDVEASAFENMALLRSAMCWGNHRDGTYTRGLIPYGGTAEIIKMDSHKVVIRDRYSLIYRVNADFK